MKLFTLIIIAFALALLLILLGETSARSSGNPLWDNIEGAANHACYQHSGVAQVIYLNRVDDGAICRDGWAVDLYDTPWKNNY